MKNKKIVSILLVVVMMFTMTVTSLAAIGNKTVKSNGSMTVQLNTGKTGDSSAVSFNVTGLPAKAVITKIEVNTGSLTYTGTVLTNYLTLKSSNSTVADKITWTGAANTKLTANAFKLSPANGVYTITFNATCLGGPIVGGQITNTGVKSYKAPSITVYWDDSF